MTLYEYVLTLKGSEFTLFFLILLLSIIILIATRYLLKLSAPFFFLGISGIIIGLGVGSIISAQFTKLPGPIGVWFPPILNIFITIAFLDLFLAQGKSLSKYIFSLMESRGRLEPISENNTYVIDTSVLIDGRILKIVDSHFLLGHYLVSNLVIREMRQMADADDPLRRGRGRRGLEVLSQLNKNPKVTIEIISQGYRRLVDEALVLLAKEKKAQLLTTDLALSKIAAIENVAILNLSELDEALKPLLFPGDDLSLHIYEGGKNRQQGVSYLPDGTMVIIEGGKAFIGSTVQVRVDKIHQTASGRIIFGRILKNDQPS